MLNKQAVALLCLCQIWGRKNKIQWIRPICNKKNFSMRKNKVNKNK